MASLLDKIISPALDFRWVIRGGKAGEAVDKRSGGNARVLQQRFLTLRGSVWRDVPVVVTDDDKGK